MRIKDPSQLIADAEVIHEISLLPVWTTYYGYIAIRKDNKTHLLHRYITKAPKGLDVDHINGNKLDNRKVNLRLCTRGQNLMNKPVRNESSTRVKGVYYDKSRHKYQVRISCGKKIHNLGRFKDIDSARIAYNNKAKELFKEFAWNANE